MKVLFLDVDGVLNKANTKEKTATGCSFVEDIFVRRLKNIVDQTGCEIVLSSDWRYDAHTELIPELDELEDKLSEYGLALYDFTPVINNHRGQEIQSWLDAHTDVGSFVILDDRGDMEPNMERLVRTLFSHGLTEENKREAIKVLNGVNANE